MKKYRVVIIGGGNVANHMIRQVTGSGHKLVQIYNRTLSALPQDGEANKTDNIHALTNDADIYIVCVKDAAIDLVAKDIRLNNKLIIHTSGTTTKEKLKDCSSMYGIFYPLQSFSKNLSVDFKQIPVIIEANSEEARNILQSFASSLTNQVIYLNEAQRIPIHIGGVLVNNFVNELFNQAAGYIAEHQLSFDLLKPLIHQTIDKLEFGSPKEMQTGPAMRGDVETIQLHLNKLQDHPHLQQIYQMMTESIQRSQEKK